MADRHGEKVPSLRQAAGQFLRLLRLVRPYWSRLFKGMVLALALGLVGIVIPYLTKLLIDGVYPTENVTLMHVLVAGILTLSVAQTLLGALSGVFTLHVNSRLSSATRLMFFNHLQHLTPRFFDHHRVGEVNSRFQDVGRALETLTRVFQTVFLQGVYLLLVPPLLFFLEWRLALVALLSIPLTFLITALSGRILRRHWKRSSEAYADLNAFQIETLSHIRSFKTMALEHQVYRKARALMEHALEQQLKAGGLSQLFGAMSGVLRGLNTALLTWFGWTLILSHQMSLGDYMAFTAYIGYLYSPLAQLGQLFSDFQQAAIHLNRMFEYLDTPTEQEPTLAYLPPSPITRRLAGASRLDKVTFGYQPERPVLDRIDLALEARSVIALVGPSGSGKTSLLRLLAGLEQPLEGTVFLDDVPLPRIPLPDLRRQISVVWQEMSLIKGTLWENLTLGREATASPAEVDRVIRLCGLEPVIAGLPRGLETPVGEGGSTLSAGQRQRVAIARALVRDVPILLFDEATANIDAETETRMLEGIFEHLRGKTVIFVTHRLATAALSDRVCVLEGGRLVGCGAHHELLAGCPTYRRMQAASANSSATRWRIRADHRYALDLSRVDGGVLGAESLRVQSAKSKTEASYSPLTNTSSSCHSE